MTRRVGSRGRSPGERAPRTCGSVPPLCIARTGSASLHPAGERAGHRLAPRRSLARTVRHADSFNQMVDFIAGAAILNQTVGCPVRPRLSDGRIAHLSRGGPGLRPRRASPGRAPGATGLHRVLRCARRPMPRGARHRRVRGVRCLDLRDQHRPPQPEGSLERPSPVRNGAGRDGEPRPPGRTAAHPRVTPPRRGATSGESPCWTRERPTLL